MDIDPDQFLDDGYVILRNVIPPDRLDELRASFETLVDRQQAIWARDRDDPRSFAYKDKQPRLSFQTLVDADTADTVEFCLHENTLGVSRQALRTPDVGLKQMFLMCNPATDYGPDLRHRDTQPMSQARWPAYSRTCWPTVRATCNGIFRCTTMTCFGSCPAASAA